MIIKVLNNLTEDAQRTYLSTAPSSGASSIPVRNINGFNSQWAIQIGETAEEKTEIQLLANTTPSGTALQLYETLTYDHPQDTPVYAIKYDKLIIKRSTTGTAGTATAISNGTIPITGDAPFTEYDDTTGASTYAYKIAYYNSYLNVQSSDSDWILPEGFSYYSLYEMRKRVKNKLKDASFIRSNEVIDGWLNEWLEKMTSSAINVNQDYLIGTANVSHGTDGLGTISQTDFKEIRKIHYTTNGVDYNNALKKNIIDFEPDEVFSEAEPYYYMQGDNVVGKLPAQSAGTARIWYYKRPPVLEDDRDELPVSMQSYSKSFVDYALSQAYYMDKEQALGDTFLGMAESEHDKFIREITPRNFTGQSGIIIEEPIDAGNTFIFY